MEMKSDAVSSVAQRFGLASAGAQDATIEARQPALDGCADSPRADDPDGGRMQVASQHEGGLPRLPAAGAHEPLALGQASRDGEHQGDREVRGRVGEHVGRVADRDSPRRRRGDVDVVGADGVVRDHPQLRRRLDQLGIDDVGQRGQQALGIGDPAQKLLARRGELCGQTSMSWTARRRPRASPGSSRVTKQRAIGPKYRCQAAATCCA